MADDDIPRFRIDGNDYAVPTQDTLTMDEAILIYDYSGLTLDQIADAPGHPKLIKALLHISYARGNPDVEPERISELVGSAVLMTTVEGASDDEVDVDPPAPATSEIASERDDSTASSGVASSATSEPSQANGHHAPTGTPESDTPPTFDPSTSEMSLPPSS